MNLLYKHLFEKWEKHGLVKLVLRIICLSNHFTQIMKNEFTQLPCRNFWKTAMVFFIAILTVLLISRTGYAQGTKEKSEKSEKIQKDLLPPEAFDRMIIKDIT